MSKDKTSGFVAGIIIGGIVGTATALIFAPKTGSEFRKDLYQAYQDLELKSEKLLAHLKKKPADDEEHSTAELLENAQALYNEAMESSAKLLEQIKQTQSNEDTKSSASN
jgi:gas vesicle protein